MKDESGHIPVLLEEVVSGLNLNKNSAVIDATLGGGGHSKEILKKLGPKGKVIGIDWDSEAAERLKKEMADEERLKIFHSNFSLLEKLAKSFRPDAILFDLGLSSLQLFSSGRGFSFQEEKGLEMLYDRSRSPDAKEFLEEVSEEELAGIIKNYGEEPYAKRIAAAIVRAQKGKKIKSAKELAEIIQRVRPRMGRIHPATKTFQALRIYLNDELENIKKGLLAGWKILKPGGRIAVLSFHSLEDRIVKNFFRERVKEGKGILINKKPIRPSRKEILINPRSRSAKLRIIEKIKK